MRLDTHNMIMEEALGNRIVEGMREAAELAVGDFDGCRFKLVCEPETLNVVTMHVDVPCWKELSSIGGQKTLNSVFELFRLRDKEVPIEVIEFSKDTSVAAFAWELNSKLTGMGDGFDGFGADPDESVRLACTILVGYYLALQGLAHLAARVRARGAVRRRAAGRLTEGGLRQADQLGVVVARRGEHHPVGHHVVGRELLQHGRRDGGEVAGRAHGRLAERRASAVGRGVAHLLQERLRVLLELLELSLHRGVRLLDLPRKELGRESRLRQQADELRHRALQCVDLIDGVLSGRERGDRRDRKSVV